MIPIVLACLIAALVIAAWQWGLVVASACQWLLERLAHASRDSSRPSRLPGEGGHDRPAPQQPRHERPSLDRPLSSPYPACCAAGLEPVDPVLPPLPGRRSTANQHKPPVWWSFRSRVSALSAPVADLLSGCSRASRSSAESAGESRSATGAERARARRRKQEPADVSRAHSPVAPRPGGGWWLA